jgi:predicted glycoside hydrolase/deacetylase ChbG (UPF0249 family)
MNRQTARYLIVNADDFGISRGVNRGIIRAHESGIVTSTSLMVDGPAAEEAAVYGQWHPTFSIGLHVDLGEWRFENDNWLPMYQRVALNDISGIAREAERQLMGFRRLLRKNPTHLDSHQHVHRHATVRNVLVELSRYLKIPLRDHSPQIRYCGGFYGQTGEGLSLPNVLTSVGLCKILEALPPGCSELGCHPGLDNNLKSIYRRERAKEVQILCDPGIRHTLIAQRIELRSFSQFAQRSTA